MEVCICILYLVLLAEIGMERQEGCWIFTSHKSWKYDIFLFTFRLFWYIKSYNSGTEIWCSQGLGQVAPKHRGLTIPNHIIICSFVEGFPKYLVCCLIFRDIINAGPIFESSVHYFPRAGPYIGRCNNYSFPTSKSSKKIKKSILVRQLLFSTKILQEKSSEDNSLS